MKDAKKVKNIVEACLMVAGRAMSLRQLDDLFEGDDDRPDKDTIKACLEELQADYEDRGIEIVRVASGYRLQSRTELSEWVARLFPEKPPRYSRALLETLVLVAYRQPITRGEIEEIRGVAVSSNIVKTLQERQWIKEVGFKDVPGKPALLGTTKLFLDYFNLKRLDDLPPLSEIKNLDEMDAALMEAAGIAPAQDNVAANDGEVDTQDSENEVGATAESEETTYAAGEANTTKTANDPSNTEPDEVQREQDSSQDPTKPVVTFAGLVSSLPSLEEANADLKPVEIAEIEQNVKPSSENSDSEINDDESLLDQPSAEETLLTTLSNFAEEHQKEIDARDELENRIKTSYTENAGEEEIASDDSMLEVAAAATEAELVVSEASESKLTEETAAADALGDLIDSASASPDVLSETFTDESPSAGETLH